MARPNYAFEKRQRELAKKKKKEEKKLQKARAGELEATDSESVPESAPAPSDPDKA
ncbi:MAG: hypothetical protein H6985_07690 [Pseudomonadales bacterium]|nr:hypothetical protein [Halioglobus sp.]MCP5129444.1 hypothetical protein [Pseudomonadales bacterium]